VAFTHAPFAKALSAATGGDEFADAFTYQDYLYEMLADGSSEKPVTERQWEMICDIIGASRRMVYASTVKHALANIAAKQAAQ
jgi:predicted translin family RNA/ssDNA-binding protein